jgi:hypothetical protein
MLSTVKAGIRRADLIFMTRSLGLVSLVLALAVVGYLASRQMGSTGPSSPAASQAIVDAGNEVAALNLQQAALTLEQHRAATGSYLAADLGALGVALARADAASYCVQTTREPVTHLAGPGGTPAAGSC